MKVIYLSAPSSTGNLPEETGRFHFLDRNDCGFWLHNESFSGARTFDGDESVKIQKWLYGRRGNREQNMPPTQKLVVEGLPR
jgi:hypothetical protein